MNRWYWYLRDGMTRLGWPGVTGLALMVYALALSATGLVDARKQEQQLDLELTQAQKPAEQKLQPTSLDTEDRLALFYQQFPKLRSTPRVLAKMYSAAASSHLILERGIYKLTSNARDHFARYEIDLPLKGPYPKIQHFAYQALQDIPTLALNDITFKREDISTTDVEADLHFTLYLVRRDG
jgi:Tfp pilus assembly protein PilO